MDGTASKAQLLDNLKDEQARWEELLRDIGEEHMTQPGVAGEWSIKDIVAHLTFWQRQTVGRFQAALRNEPLPPPPWPPHMGTEDEISARDEVSAWDEVNAWICITNRDRPVSDVLRESRDVFQLLVETLDAFPEGDLFDSACFPWLGGFFGHFHEEHEPDMRAWLERIRREER